MHTTFENDACKMVLGDIVLARGVQTRTLYNIFRSIVIDGCNSTIVHENETNTTHTVPVEIVIL